MPVERSKDSDGPFYRWGKTGAKYRYTTGDARSRERAKARAARQGRAAKASMPRGAPRREPRSAPRTGGAPARRIPSTRLAARPLKSHHWILRQGKLGGPGYLTKPPSKRKRLLKSCMRKYGYQSCLESVLVLARNRKVNENHRNAIEADRLWLEQNYGPEARFRR
jgi:hypothetical protein